MVAREARKRESHRVRVVRAYVGLEAEAVEIKTWDIELVPGLFRPSPTSEP